MGQLERERRRIESLITGLRGQVAWSAIVGPRGDYVLALELGEQRRRSMRLANPRLSFLQRTYEGEYSLLVECPWRLDGPKGVVLPCFEVLARTGTEPLPELGEIVDHPVEQISVEPAGWDLTIAFSGGFVLRCYAVEAGARGKRNNWAYWSPAGLLTIGPRGRVVEQSRAQAEAGFQRLARVLEEAEDEERIHPPADRERPPSDEP